MLTKIFAGSFLALGLAVGGTAYSGGQAFDCCELGLPCCGEGAACCEAEEKPDCCANGGECCVEVKACCTSGK